MSIVNYYITKNPYFNDGRWITGSSFKGFFLHSVGVGQPDPMVFIRNWNKPNYTNAGISGFIGANTTYITAPCLETKGRVKRMPHAGKTATNNTYIGFEMCEPGTIRYTGGASFVVSNLEAAQEYCRKTYANAVELFAKLCSFHGKNPLTPGVIYSHNEAGKLGIATTHVDPEHLWSGLKLPYTMDGFRRDVYNKMHESEEKPMTKSEILKTLGDEYIATFNDLPEWAKPSMREIMDKGFVVGDSASDPNDIGMFLSDIKSIIVSYRMMKGGVEK